MRIKLNIRLAVCAVVRELQINKQLVVTNQNSKFYKLFLDFHNAISLEMALSLLTIPMEGTVSRNLMLYQLEGVKAGSQ